MKSALFLLCFAAATTALADVKVAGCTVATQPGATPAELHAAQELQDHLAKITGSPIALESDATKTKPNLILVGQGPLAKRLFPKVDWGALGEEQTLIKSKGQLLLVAGGRPRGTLYAVYRLLQQKCGVQWWAPWATRLPKKPWLTFKNMDWTETPAFEYRDPYWSHSFDPDWAARNFDNGFNVRADDAHGGKVLYQGFVHTYYGLVPPDKLFATHPEWYSLIDGKRTHDNAQLCTTNPELREYVVGKVREELLANPKATIISVSQNDCFNPCQCPVCRALSEKEGSDAALVLDLANYVGEKIEKEFPHVAVDTLAYQWSRHPVKAMRPRKNVIVRLCSIECNFAQPLFAPANQNFANDIEGWGKLTNRLYVWDYCTNFAHYLQPQPDYFALGPTLRWFSENGVKGVFEEGDYTSAGGDMAELKAWLIGQMLWDPKLNPSELINEFLTGYYGTAGAPIRQYLELVTEAAQKDNVTFALGSSPSFCSYAVMSKAEALWQRAKALAGKGSPEFAQRVQFSHLSVESVWLQHWKEFRAACAQAGDKWPFEADGQQAASRWLAECKQGPADGGPRVTAVDEGGTSPDKFIASLNGELVDH